MTGTDFLFDIAVLQFDDQIIAVADLFANLATEGDDILDGTDGDDVIDALGGNDIVNGLGGADTLLGNAGRDTLFGDGDSDFLNGGGDNDSLNGGGGINTLTTKAHDCAKTVTVTIGQAPSHLRTPDGLRRVLFRVRGRFIWPRSCWNVQHSTNILR